LAGVDVTSALAFGGFPDSSIEYSNEACVGHWDAFKDYAESQWNGIGRFDNASRTCKSILNHFALIILCDIVTRILTLAAVEWSTVEPHDGNAWDFTSNQHRNSSIVRPLLPLIGMRSPIIRL
jgi:hypothetical protein